MKAAYQIANNKMLYTWMNFLRSTATPEEWIAERHIGYTLSTVVEIKFNLTRNAWWRQQMETSSALLALFPFCGEFTPVTGEFPSQRPVTRSLNAFFDLRMNKWLSKQW